MKRLLFTLPLVLLTALTPLEARQEDERDRYEQAIHRLEQAMEVLDHMGEREGIEILKRAADRLRSQRKKEGLGSDRPDRRDPRRTDRADRSDERTRAMRADKERQWAEQMIEALKLAEKAWSEAEREEAADSSRLAYLSIKMRIEGRRDEEARQVIEGAPSMRERAKLLLGASELYTKWGLPDRAEKTAHWAKELLQDPSKREAREKDQAQERRAREQGRARGEDEQHLRERQIKALKLAAEAWAEKGHERRAEAALTTAQRLAGEADGKPIGPEDRLELLGGASRLYAERGETERAQFLAQVYEQLKKTRAEAPPTREARGDQSAEIQELRRHMAKLQDELEKHRVILEKMRRMLADDKR